METYSFLVAANFIVDVRMGDSLPIFAMFNSCGFLAACIYGLLLSVHILGASPIVAKRQICSVWRCSSALGTLRLVCQLLFSALCYVSG